MEILNHSSSTTLQPKIKKTNENKPLLLQQGTYGCVYYPGFTCKGDKQTIKYVSKLEKINETLNNELEIGEKIRQIKNYKNYFAPILRQCPVDISKLEIKYPQQMNKCKIISESQKKITNNNNFTINKIRYILGKDLDDTFEKINIYSKLFII